jgi:hypothetical protein
VVSGPSLGGEKRYLLSYFVKFPNVAGSAAGCCIFQAAKGFFLAAAEFFIALFLGYYFLVRHCAGGFCFKNTTKLRGVVFFKKTVALGQVGAYH